MPDRQSMEPARVAELGRQVLSCIKVRGWLRREAPERGMADLPGASPAPREWEDLTIEQHREAMPPWIDTLPGELEVARFAVEAVQRAEEAEIRALLSSLHDAIREGIVVLTQELERRARRTWKWFRRLRSELEPAEAAGMILIKLEKGSPPEDPRKAEPFLAWCDRVFRNHAKDRLRKRCDNRAENEEVPEEPVAGRNETRRMRRDQSVRAPHPRGRRRCLIRIDEIFISSEHKSPHHYRFAESDLRTDPLSECDLQEMESWGNVIVRLMWPIDQLFLLRVPQDRWWGERWVAHPLHVGARPLPSTDYWLEPDALTRHRALASDLNISPEWLSQLKTRYARLDDPKYKASIANLTIADPEAWEQTRTKGDHCGSSAQSEDTP